ncbi:hypothetical protein BN8_p06798 (plasmid) [Fibrisoma limi BUZ 3]|uniref:Conjugative transposon protein TraO n=1 Tax=Fibrisoma limi BUZ 3 TaxID=1185876 RepID=I2GU03_9BACT|nr:hypothetical protein BN8_p06798 [Fibrisoma limi BUZ 3]
MDNLPKFSGQQGNGYMGSVDYVWYRQNERYWKASFSYLRKNFTSQSSPRPRVEQYCLAIDYVPRGIYTTRRWLYLAPTAGLYVGYESINRNQSNLSEGIIQNKSTALVGPQLGLEAEAYVGPSVAILAGVTERFVPFSDLAKFRTIGYVGIRYCFFQ